MQFFLAGIMQGSLVEMGILDQSYRDALRDLLLTRFPQAHVLCPLELNPDSVNYGLAESRACFFSMIQEATRSDLVVAYLPSASMGTAVEMYAAYQAGVPVISISPMQENWAIRLLSQMVFPSLSEFEAFVQAGGIERVLGLSD
ncbi:MAG: hypothetical protein KKA73_13465 [Chloroflexi bacterium]|nr:hypothetical protein [Chloroflexota bacterium]MBU1748690.1 hypothetical protein [Chloroflexota bacterium]MBU1880373.1 hypothetical protein [Chloroflexota bacterium]